MSASVGDGLQLGHTANGFRLRFPSSTTFLSPARLMVNKWLGHIQAPVDGWDLVITEMLSNAMNASPSSSDIKLEIGFQGDQIRCCVTNEGPWDHPDLRGGTESDLGLLAQRELTMGSACDSHRGRGISLICQLTDGACAQHHDGRTAVTVWRNL